MHTKHAVTWSPSSPANVCPCEPANQASSWLISCSLNHVNCFWRGRRSLDGGSSASCPTSTAALKYSSPESHTSQTSAGQPARTAVLLRGHRGFSKPLPSSGHGDELHTRKYRGQHSFDFIYLSKSVFFLWFLIIIWQIFTFAESIHGYATCLTQKQTKKKKFDLL